MKVKKPTIQTFGRVATAYLADRIVSRHYGENVMRVAAKCGEVSVERVNAYLRTISAEKASTTVRAERTILLTLYRWGYETGMIAEAPRGVMRIKSRKKPTKAWTIEQLRSLIGKE